MQLRLALNSQFSSLSLARVGVKGRYHHALLSFVTFKTQAGCLGGHDSLFSGIIVGTQMPSKS